MVSAAVTVRVLATLPSVRLSAPAPRLIEPVVCAAPSVMVSARVPPVMVSMLDR